MKSRESIAYAAAKGVEWYVIDSLDELRRVFEIKPDAKLYLRIATPNIGSDWPLSGKFGAGAGDAREIVAAAAKLGADLAGITFHVGSQCRNPENWRVALEKARSLFDLMTKAGLKPRLLNIGGGYPVRHVKPIPSIEVIGNVGQRGPEGLPGRRAGHRRAGPLPRLRRRLLRLPGARHRQPRRQALDALGRGPVRRRDRGHRRASGTASAPTAPARTSPGRWAGRPATRSTS